MINYQLSQKFRPLGNDEFNHLSNILIKAKVWVLTKEIEDVIQILHHSKEKSYRLIRGIKDTQIICRDHEQ